MQPKKRHPIHPGEVLSEDFLKPLNISPSAFAKMLGGKWKEQEINAIIEGKANINETAAEALAAALDTPPQFWMQLQTRYLQWDDLHRRK